MAPHTRRLVLQLPHCPLLKGLDLHTTSSNGVWAFLLPLVFCHCMSCRFGDAPREVGGLWGRDEDRETDPLPWSSPWWLLVVAWATVSLLRAVHLFLHAGSMLIASRSFPRISLNSITAEEPSPRT